MSGANVSTLVPACQAAGCEPHLPELFWRACLTGMADMLRSTWRWQVHTRCKPDLHTPHPAGATLAWPSRSLASHRPPWPGAKGTTPNCSSPLPAKPCRASRSNNWRPELPAGGPWLGSGDRRRPCRSAGATGGALGGGARRCGQTMVGDAARLASGAHRRQPQWGAQRGAAKRAGAPGLEPARECGGGSKIWWARRANGRLLTDQRAWPQMQPRDPRSL